MSNPMTSELYAALSAAALRMGYRRVDASENFAKPVGFSVVTINVSTEVPNISTHFYGSDQKVLTWNHEDLPLTEEALTKDWLRGEPITHNWVYFIAHYEARSHFTMSNVPVPFDFTTRVEEFEAVL
jgi:hypothetical protein